MTAPARFELQVKIKTRFHDTFRVCVCIVRVQISALSGEALNWRAEPTVATTTTSNNHSNDQNTNIPTATEVDPSLYDGIKLGEFNTD